MKKVVGKAEARQLCAMAQSVCHRTRGLSAEAQLYRDMMGGLARFRGLRPLNRGPGGGTSRAQREAGAS